MKISRPKLHFTPPKGWMNDPNGLIYANGLYHLFYQSEPTGRRLIHNGAGANMAWGHATSRDLFTWEHRPVAIHEEASPDVLSSIYSGSAVLDVKNVSGLGIGDGSPILAFYTDMQFRRVQGNWCPVHQPIAMAYSLDGGETFTKYAANPIIPTKERKFGDPKVFWHAPSTRWVMVTIRGMDQGRIEFYGSRNLLDWEFLGDFRTDQTGRWECPDLVPLCVDDNPEDVRWILKYDPWDRVMLGRFDGHRFELEAELPRCVFGDLYADVTFNNVPNNRTIMVGWIRESADPKRQWVGLQSIPRSLSLKTTAQGLRLMQQPVRELEAFLKPPVEPQDLGDSNGCCQLPSPAAEIKVKTPLRDCILTLDLEDGTTRRIRYVEAKNRLTLHAGERTIVLTPDTSSGQLTYQLILDRGALEIFVGSGEQLAAIALPPNQACTQMRWRGFDRGSLRLRDYAE